MVGSKVGRMKGAFPSALSYTWTHKPVLKEQDAKRRLGFWQDPVVAPSCAGSQPMSWVMGTIREVLCGRAE